MSEGLSDLAEGHTSLHSTGS